MSAEGGGWFTNAVNGRTTSHAFSGTNTIVIGASGGVGRDKWYVASATAAARLRSRWRIKQGINRMTIAGSALLHSVADNSVGPGIILSQLSPATSAIMRHYSCVCLSAPARRAASLAASHHLV